MNSPVHPPSVATDNHVLRIDSVHKDFGTGSQTSQVLDGIDLQLKRGEVVAVVGPSGCGKTTLLRIIQGLDFPSSGSVAWVGESQRTPRMSYVFQRASLLPWYDVRTNVALGVRMRAGKGIYPTREDEKEAVEKLLALTGLSAYGDYMPTQISGGMQQRANVARALAVQPDVLLLDEPFSALDALTRERLQADVARILAELNTTAVHVTHDIREAVFLADRIVVMRAHPGRIHEIVDVPEPRPRSAEFQHSSRLAQLERSIWEMLHP